MAKVLATDLDGTLFFPKKRIRMIHPKSLQFLRRFIDDGNKVVLVSGRNQNYAEKVIKKIKRPVDAIGCNASYILSNGELIKETYFDNKEAMNIINEITRKYKVIAMMIFTKEGNYISKETFSFFYMIGYLGWYHYQGALKEKFHFVNAKKFRKALETTHIRKVMLMFGLGEEGKVLANKANKEIREKYADLFEASWSGEMIEFSPNTCSKAEGLKYYANYHKINANDIIVVGDSGNDISMFNEYQENSFCMDMAPLSVSKYAKHTIKNFWDLEKFIERK